MLMLRLLSCPWLSLLPLLRRYIEARRPFHHRRPMLHYNSWFDFFTWQEADGIKEDINYLTRFDPNNPLLAQIIARKVREQASE